MRLVAGEVATMLAMAAALAGASPVANAPAAAPLVLAGPVETRQLRYGTDPRQVATLFTRGVRRAPLIVYLHGGGWSAGTPKAGSGGEQAAHWTSRGYAYATLGYRLVPAASVEQQRDELATGIALLRRQRGVDGQRIVLLGHSSGGHLAALLGSDPAPFVRAKMPFGALKAVVLLDAAGLDVPQIMAIGGPLVDRYYRPAFGDKAARWQALSPLAHIERPNAPAWLLLHDVNNRLAALQGANLAAQLRQAGSTVMEGQIAETTHLRLNDEIGRANDVATAAVDRFLATSVPPGPPRLR